MKHIERAHSKKDPKPIAIPASEGLGATDDPAFSPTEPQPIGSQQLPGKDADVHAPQVPDPKPSAQDAPMLEAADAPAPKVAGPDLLGAAGAPAPRDHEVPLDHEVPPTRKPMEDSEFQDTPAVDEPGFQQQVLADLAVLKRALGVEAGSQPGVTNSSTYPPSSVAQILELNPWVQMKDQAAEEGAGDGECAEEYFCSICNSTIAGGGKVTKGRLSYAVQRHSEASRHKDGESKRRKLDARAEFNAKTQEAAARHVGFQILHSIHEEDSSRRIEREFALLSTMGLPIGDINHSRKLHARICSNLFDEMVADLRSFFTSTEDRTGRRPATSVAFDKMTVNRRTILIVVVSAVFNGSIRAFAAPFQVCGSVLGGDHILELVLKAIEPICGCAADCIPSISSLPCDGELRSKILPALSRAKWPQFRGVGDQTGWLAVPWDAAHLLELGRKDAAREDVVGDWVGRLVGVAKEVSRKYQHGKEYELLLETRDMIVKMAEENEWDNESRLTRHMSMTTHNFSETRWAAFEGRAFGAIVRIFPAMVRLLGMEASELTPSTRVPSASALSAKEFKDEIAGADYVISLLGMADACARIGKLSESLQTVDIAPWCRLEGTRAAIAELEADARSIRGLAGNVQVAREDGTIAPSRPDDHRFPLLCELLTGLDDQRDGAITFRGVELHLSEERGSRDTAAAALGKVAAWIDTVTQSVAARLGKPWPSGRKLCCSQT